MNKKKQNRSRAMNNNNEEMFEYGEDENYVPKDNDGGYEGAVRIETSASIYLEEPVTVLEFKLYPPRLVKIYLMIQ